MLIQDGDTFVGGPLDVLCILYDAILDVHVVGFLEWTPLPGPAIEADDVEVVRLKSRLVVKAQTSDRASVEKAMRALAGRILIPPENVWTEPMPWSGQLTPFVVRVPNWRRGGKPDLGWPFPKQTLGRIAAHWWAAQLLAPVSPPGLNHEGVRRARSLFEEAPVALDPVAVQTFEDGLAAWIDGQLPRTVLLQTSYRPDPHLTEWLEVAGLWGGAACGLPSHAFMVVEPDGVRVRPGRNAPYTVLCPRSTGG